MQPDRPLSGPLALLRPALHKARIMRARLGYRGTLTIGKDFTTGTDLVLASEGPIQIGARVRFGRGVHIETALEIGDDVLISSYVGFVGNDHPFDDPTKTVFNQGRAAQATIRLEGDNLIGFGAVIVGSVTIGQGAIIGAGSVVTTDVPPNTVSYGAPAKVRRQRHAA
jgi:acetyltransferase-like isoleucine patch superfamily enzyme